MVERAGSVYPLLPPPPPKKVSLSCPSLIFLPLPLSLSLSSPFLSHNQWGRRLESWTNAAARRAGWKRVTQQGVILYVMDSPSRLPWRTTPLSITKCTQNTILSYVRKKETAWYYSIPMPSLCSQQRAMNILVFLRELCSYASLFNSSTVSLSFLSSHLSFLPSCFCLFLCFSLPIDVS